MEGRGVGRRQGQVPHGYTPHSTQYNDHNEETMSDSGLRSTDRRMSRMRMGNREYSGNNHQTNGMI